MTKIAASGRLGLEDSNWRAHSFFAQTVEAERGRMQGRGAQIVAYWRDEFANFDPKLRSNISITLTTMLDRFNHGWLQEALCGATTIVPELCFHGAIILLNMPALTLNEDGIIAQQVIKYMWQRAVLARNGLHPSQQDRPVFLWADEAQYFVNSYDAEFLSTCRGSKACTVFLSQSLPTYYAKVAGDNARDRVHHLLGNFATKVFHSNGCAETNEWAARSLGKIKQYRASYSTNEGTSSSWGYSDGMNMGDGGSTSYASASLWANDARPGMPTGYSSSNSRGENRGSSEGVSTTSGTGHSSSEQMDFVIQPGEFARILKTGGPANGNIVSGVWFQSGRRFQHTAGNALLASFAQ